MFQTESVLEHRFFDRKCADEKDRKLLPKINLNQIIKGNFIGKKYNF